MTAEILSSLTEHVSPEDPLRDAARRLVARHTAELPDLSGVVVLLPTLHAAAPLARALASVSGCATLLLPQMTTLPQWAGQVPLDLPRMPELARQALVYGALRERGWFREQERWGLARELLTLFDALTLHRLGLPDTAEALAARLAAAYGAREGESLRFEARLVHELWQAMQGVLADQVDAAGAYARQLAVRAQEACRPLYAIGLARLSPVEEEFLVRYAERQPVRLWLPQPLDPAGGPLSRLLATAWTPAPTATLAQRAADLARELPTSPLVGRLRLYGATSLERLARAADLQVRRWLSEGKRSIAIVAQNRLAARRLRAILEQSAVLVADETGWTLSTAAAASAIMRWLDLLSGDFHYRELLDLLKSPMVFADLEPGPRREAVYQLERLIRRRNLVSRLAHYRAAAREENTPCLTLLERLESARRLWPKDEQPLLRWFQALAGTLDVLGITLALQADLAGTQLLGLLAALNEDAAAAPGRFTFVEWRRLLEQGLESATFRDTRIDSPVVFTHLAATRLRRFDGVILLGCADGELPAAADTGLFFNQGVRADLGLPTRAEETAAQLSDLATLIAASSETLALWQSREQGEERLLSPWLDLLATLHDLAWGDDLVTEEMAGASPPPEARPAGTPRPTPRLDPAQVPGRISASGYNSLLSCPYQYYARHVLRLNEEDEVKLEMEKQDFGEAVHRVLALFHSRHPCVSTLTPEQARAALHEITDEVFAPLLALNYLSHAWKLQWEALLPAYLDWQRQREAEGWSFAQAELPRRRRLELGEDLSLELVGTLDRVDTSEGRQSVIDYKTTAPERLRQRLNAAGEDVQLPVYALLAEGPVSSALYLSLARGEVRPLALPRDVGDEAEAVQARLLDIFRALHAGAPLPAHGHSEVCGGCEMAGLCRRAYWSEAG